MPNRTVYTVPSQPKEVRTEFLREAESKGVSFLAELGEYFIAEAGSPDLVWRPIFLTRRMRSRFLRSQRARKTYEDSPPESLAGTFSRGITIGVRR